AADPARAVIARPDREHHSGGSGAGAPDDEHGPAGQLPVACDLHADAGAGVASLRDGAVAQEFPRCDRRAVHGALGGYVRVPEPARNGYRPHIAGYRTSEPAPESALPRTGHGHRTTRLVAGGRIGAALADQRV